MFRLELKFNENCTMDEKTQVLEKFVDLFIHEEIECVEIADSTYSFVSERKDNKLLGSFWNVLFRIKRDNYDIPKLFEQFDWIYYIYNSDEIRENLIHQFFAKE